MTAGLSYDVPVIETCDESVEFVRGREENNEPVVWINMIDGETWCFVECDFEPTIDLNENLQDAIALSEKGVEAVNELCSRYIDADKMGRPYGKSLSRLSIGAPKTTVGATHTTYPDMRPENARKFAEELVEIVTDSANRARAGDAEARRGD